MSPRLHTRALAALIVAGACGAAEAAAVVFSATGATAADITGSVNGFRGALGTLNPNVAGSFGTGRREINWDGVPDPFAAPNALPADFFNVNSPRGAAFSTPGTGFQVSANAVNPTGTPIEFGNLDPSYPGLFATFTAQKLFTAIGSNIVDVHFFVPGSTVAAYTSGFGAVFTDVDLAGSTSVAFFDVNGQPLGTFTVPPFGGSASLSFLGVHFNAGEQVGSVRIVSGNGALGAGVVETAGLDLVAMDDFIYGEPIAAVPLAGTALLLGAGLAAGALRRRRAAPAAA